MPEQGRRSDRIFARIAQRYDRINQLLSLGREQAWRRRAAAFLPAGRLLDLGSGTGAAAPLFGDREVVALDPVGEMLARSPLRDRVLGRAERLPFADGSFAAVFSAYVLRNVDSVAGTLDEIARVLARRGTAVLVDLCRPRDPVSRRVHRLASAAVLPVAGLLAGAPDGYWYLHRSLDKLPPPEQLFAAGPLRLEQTWRMGPLGSVYGAVLRAGQ